VCHRRRWNTRRWLERSVRSARWSRKRARRHVYCVACASSSRGRACSMRCRLRMVQCVSNACCSCDCALCGGGYTVCDWMLNQCLRIRAAHNALRYATLPTGAQRGTPRTELRVSLVEPHSRKPIGRHCTDHRADRRHPCGLFCWAERRAFTAVIADAGAAWLCSRRVHQAVQPTHLTSPHLCYDCRWDDGSASICRRSVRRSAAPRQRRIF